MKEKEWESVYEMLEQHRGKKKKRSLKTAGL